MSRVAMVPVLHFEAEAGGLLRRSELRCSSRDVTFVCTPMMMGSRASRTRTLPLLPTTSLLRLHGLTSQKPLKHPLL